MRAKAQRLKREKGLDLLIVDYMQLMAGHGRFDNRTQEVSMISRGLKLLAKELRVPIIALSQLSRQPEQRKGELRKPQLADLRDSGSIEQDADVVVFLYREELYDKETERKGIADVIIAKQRNGPTGDFPLVFLGRPHDLRQLRRRPAARRRRASRSSRVGIRVECGRRRVRERSRASEPPILTSTPAPPSARSSTSTRSRRTIGGCADRVGAAAGLRGREGRRLRPRRRGGRARLAREGADRFAVANAEEGVALRRAGVAGEVLVLSRAEPRGARRG